MGYALCHSACFGCGRIIAFNPMRVPSITSPTTGTREPICLDCVKRANVARFANGLLLIVPHPDAYEPCDEGELP